MLIEPEQCTGCGTCVAACPCGVIYFNEGLNLAQKCTGCAHLLDAGYELPRCVEACPTNALRFGEEGELADLIIGATVLKPETGARPRVHYRNIPGKFISGTVYDPVDREVVIGARVLLTSGASSSRRSQTSTATSGSRTLRLADTT